MKAFIIFSLNSLLTLFVSAQETNLTGTWKGTLQYNNGLFPYKTIEVTVSIKQDDRSIRAVYMFNDLFKADSCDCKGKLTAQLAKKNNFAVTFYQDGIIENKLPVNSCSNFEGFKVSYLKSGDEEKLEGYTPTTFFRSDIAIPPSPLGFTSPSGRASSYYPASNINYDSFNSKIVLKKVSSNTDVDVARYFSKTN